MKALLEAGANPQIPNNNGKLAGEVFDEMFPTEHAEEVQKIMYDYRAAHGLLPEREKNPLLWYLDEEDQ